MMKAQKKVENTITLIEQGEFDYALQILKSTLLEGETNNNYQFQYQGFP